ncbi:domain S-box/diguanylate cyclase (GGDEF) domain-containing protein [Candidatus Omnitrophus magneticus]|uniref:diguanylate cyclase n=1 Tax=Candidatus Omnitrophus magneticus TaxID=1609969 RepID=A0A0F0CMQ0_9BACT|nr:domain S-box/diguanylate cyclase (GGDEF) domain-containing protein [Candidatus Omnitrophus magneticus]
MKHIVQTVLFLIKLLFYVATLTAISLFLFNILLTKLNNTMYKYFIKIPSAYNEEIAARKAESIYQSFREEVTEPTLENIKIFVKKYNNIIEFLTINFLYPEPDGTMKMVVESANYADVLAAKDYPIKYGSRAIGTLLIYDVKTKYEHAKKEYDQFLLYIRITFGSVVGLLFFLIFFREVSLKIKEQKQLAEYSATHDGLTGLYTHKYIKDCLSKILQKACKEKHPLSIIMCDIDFFKRVNDTYGHLAGDIILKTVAEIISNNIRSSDIVARYGGEEFAVILTYPRKKSGTLLQKNTMALLEEPLEVAKRIKKSIENNSITLLDGKMVNVTLSMGLSFLNCLGPSPVHTSEEFIKEADTALYYSKEHGRNAISYKNLETEEMILIKD